MQMSMEGEERTDRVCILIFFEKERKRERHTETERKRERHRERVKERERERDILRQGEREREREFEFLRRFICDTLGKASVRKRNDNSHVKL